MCGVLGELRREARGALPRPPRPYSPRDILCVGPVASRLQKTALHRQPEAGTRETCRGDPRPARAIGTHESLRLAA